MGLRADAYDCQVAALSWSVFWHLAFFAWCYLFCMGTAIYTEDEDTLRCAASLIY